MASQYPPSKVKALQDKCIRAWSNLYLRRSEWQAFCNWFDALSPAAKRELAAKVGDDGRYRLGDFEDFGA